MEEKNLKKRIIIKYEKIQELLDCIGEMKRKNDVQEKIKILESI